MFKSTSSNCLPVNGYSCPAFVIGFQRDLTFRYEIDNLDEERLSFLCWSRLPRD